MLSLTYGLVFGQSILIKHAPVHALAPPIWVFPEHPAKIKDKKTRKHNPIVYTNPFALIVLIINEPLRFSGDLKVSVTVFRRFKQAVTKPIMSVKAPYTEV